MIESRFWKEDLLKHANKLKPSKKPKRWSERAVVNFEKELIVSFFYIRKLLETNKVSKKAANYKTKIFSCTSKKEITWINYYEIDEIYDLANERTTPKSIRFIANQFIHSCTLVPYRLLDRNWGGIYICSDLERNKTLYRIPISEIREIFELIGNDYPSKMVWSYNKEKKDYDIVSE